jgi:2-polyprenyl-6-hydroxyphenyl methylase/3-demethylubiquinone-9 3-methyltransferase
MTTTARDEIAKGHRFTFGANWTRFLSILNDARIADAEESLRTMLGVPDLHGKSFLDIGSGSGLFSLAARRLGASVTSFDYDPQSVKCTEELRSRYFPNDSRWSIEQASALDTEYVRSKGLFDVVYSWGVLHHTGDMWRGLGNAAIPVAASGRLFVAIYNDQGNASVRWLRVKRLYCSGLIGRAVVCATLIPFFVAKGIVGDVLRARNPLKRYLESSPRGMSVFYDWFDWLGGLPFEVAKPEDVFRFYRDRGFTLANMVTAGGGVANNEFVFVRR